MARTNRTTLTSRPVFGPLLFGSRPGKWYARFFGNGSTGGIVSVLGNHSCDNSVVAV